MPRRLERTLSDFRNTLAESQRLVQDAYAWTAVTGGLPRMTIARQHLITEVAFLKAFLAWESFIEQSFVFYLFGHRPPRGRPPVRLAFPPSLGAAKEWVVPEGRLYPSWEDAGMVCARAERFFREGRPYTTALRANQSVIKEITKLRNAVAHKSEKAQLTFIEVARNRIGNVAPGLTVGSFLVSNVLRSTPPISHLEFYLERLDTAAAVIVPA